MSVQSEQVYRSQRRQRRQGFVDLWVEVQGVRLYAKASGNAFSSSLSSGPPAPHPPVVLIHGLSMSHRYLMPTAHALAGVLPVLALDLPGFGRSDAPAHTFTIAEKAEAVQGWLDALGLDRVSMLGNSFGCQVIVEFALRHPHRIERAVLVGPTVDPAGRTVRQQVTRLLLDALLAEPFSLYLIALHDYFAAGPRRTLATLRYLLDDPITDKLPHVQTETLVVRGARDRIAPQAWAEEAVRLLPHAKLAVLPGASHAANYHRPAQLAAVVLPFLQEGRRPGE